MILGRRANPKVERKMHLSQNKDKHKLLGRS